MPRVAQQAGLPPACPQKPQPWPWWWGPGAGLLPLWASARGSGSPGAVRAGPRSHRTPSRSGGPAAVCAHVRICGGEQDWCGPLWCGCGSVHRVCVPFCAHSVVDGWLGGVCPGVHGCWCVVYGGTDFVRMCECKCVCVQVCAQVCKCTLCICIPKCVPRYIRVHVCVSAGVSVQL